MRVVQHKLIKQAGENTRLGKKLEYKRRQMLEILGDHIMYHIALRLYFLLWSQIVLYSWTDWGAETICFSFPVIFS